MFRFSTLLTKSEADASAGEPPGARPDQPPAGDAALPGPSACVSDRVRRDLDEQMKRLGDLLERVESIEFDDQAAASEMLTVGEPPPRVAPANRQPPEPEEVPVPAQPTSFSAAAVAAHTPGASSSTARPVGSGMPAGARKTTGCDVVLSSGRFADMSELPAERCGPPTFAESQPAPPASNARRRPNQELPANTPRLSPSRTQRSFGIVRDYAGSATTCAAARPTAAIADAGEAMDPGGSDSAPSVPRRRRSQRTTSAPSCNEGKDKPLPPASGDGTSRARAGAMHSERAAVDTAIPPAPTAAAPVSAATPRTESSPHAASSAGHAASSSPRKRGGLVVDAPSTRRPAGMANEAATFRRGSDSPAEAPARNAPGATHPATPAEREPAAARTEQQPGAGSSLRANVPGDPVLAEGHGEIGARVDPQHTAVAGSTGSGAPEGAATTGSVAPADPAATPALSSPSATPATPAMQQSGDTAAPRPAAKARAVLRRAGARGALAAASTPAGNTEPSANGVACAEPWTLNVLALCGGLLALAALLYVAADLVNWF